MPQRQNPLHLPALRDYSSLRRAVRETLITGQKQIEALKVQIYWKTGHLMRHYLNTHPEETKHGTHITDRLAADLDLERSLFYRLLQFAETFPNVVPGRHLSWTHYRALLSVSDGAKRKELVREAEEATWPVRRLRLEIQKRSDERVKTRKVKGKAPLQEPPKRLPGSYRVGWFESVEGKQKKVVDLGFYVYQNLLPNESKRLKTDSFVSWSKTKQTWVKDSRIKHTYAYSGTVERVVDGDTLLVQVDLGLEGVQKRHYLRLRGIDAPKRTEPVGKKAHAFLLRLFKKSSRIHFQSRSRDPYDRYLSDVWTSQDLYVNQALLDRGFAEKY